MITNEIKSTVITELRKSRGNFNGSDAKFAVSLGISSAVLSRLFKGEVERILSDANWVSIARKLGISLTNEKKWNTAITPTFTYITEQLNKCKFESISSMLCDVADLGKTYTAKIYAKTNRNSVYIDCSQVKSKQKLIRFIAKEFGVNHTGKYHDVYEDLVYYLRSIERPVIILDEAGDLDYSAFLELKAIWNATEGACGWMMMGADGLKEKIRRAIDCKKVGYTEIFSRYGNRYQKISPEGKQAQEQFTRLQAGLIIQANSPENTDIKQIIASTDGSLRRIKIELSKLN